MTWGSESGALPEITSTRREAQVEQEDDRCTTWSERERIGDRVVSEGPEQSRLKWRWIGAPDTN